MEALHRAIWQALGKADPPLRLALLGVGQDLRGDDAAGLLLAQRLAARLPRSPNLLILDAGPAPENFTGALRRFQPDLVVLADAAWMELEPGTLRWLNPSDADGAGGFTHSLPLSVVAGYLEQELGCTVRILAIQARSVEFGAPISQEINQAIGDLVNNLILQ